MSAKRKRGRHIGETLGGIIVGFDQQIFRTVPPVQELIAKAQPVRGTSGQDGTEFEVVFPDDQADLPSPEAPVEVEPESGPGT
ncbi:MAG: hypothetical protein ABIP77_06890 [Candidatus Limnocylindrales bacterium]